MPGKLSMRGQWARSLVVNELLQELPIHQSHGKNFGVPSGGGCGHGAFELPRDYTQEEDEKELKGSIRAIPPLPVWPNLKICIVGAGVSGLYTAMILDSLEIPNLTYEILESSERVGGRLYTHHFDEEQEHQYYDVGAMRFPRLKIMNRQVFLLSAWNSQLITSGHLICSGESVSKTSSGNSECSKLLPYVHNRHVLQPHIGTA
jgi:hypothetical protein